MEWPQARDRFITSLFSDMGKGCIVNMLEKVKEWDWMNYEWRTILKTSEYVERYLLGLNNEESLS